MKRKLLLLLVMIGSGALALRSQTAAALNFDGNDDYVQLADPNFGTGDLTVETWLYPVSTSSIQYLITTRSSEVASAGNWWNLYYNGSTQQVVMEMANAQLASGLSVVSPAGALAPNAWNHVAVVRSNSVITIYVNGAVSTSSADIGIRNFVTGNNSLRFGGWPDFNLAFFGGSMDETRLWNTARTAADIAAGYLCQLSGTTHPGLVRYYRYNQGLAASNNATVTILNDDSGNSFNGTLTNFALTGSTSNWIAGGAVSAVVVSVPNYSVCPGMPVVVTPTGAATYSFASGNGNFTLMPSATASYSVIGTGTNGCLASPAIFTITVNSNPTVAINSASVCAGSSVAIIPTGALAYTINGGTFTVSPLSTTSYSVSGIDANGCISGQVVATITVNALPALQLAPSATTICLGETTSITATGSPATYSWSSSQTGALLVITPTISGIESYTVTGTGANGCVTTALVTLATSNCTGIPQNAAALISGVYPNPNNGQFIVDTNENATVIVMNALGQVIYTEKANSGKVLINISHLANGIYFVKTLDQGRQRSVRVVKE